jgi:transposase InsO family protein
MLVELKVVEQRYRAVTDVLDGMNVTDVARLNGVARQTVHIWVRRYAAGGMAALVDQSTKPLSCPHQMDPHLEARVLQLRDMHQGWGQRSIRTQLAKEGHTPLPGLSSIYRTLVRHHRIDPTKRKRSRSDYKRWERSRSMDLWQMDIVGRFHLLDRTELKMVSGLDDHSRFCVSARLILRATAKPVVAALEYALKAHGVPDQILTDNGKVFTARFGPGPGPVLFDRICTLNDIEHILTKPYSPTTTGKVERFHKTLRKEFFTPNDYVFATIEEAQEALDTWVNEYNTERPHQSLGDRPPSERFALARTRRDPEKPADEATTQIAPAAVPRPGGVTRWVDQRGVISLGAQRYRVGPTYVGESVEVVVQNGIVEILHGAVVVATHAERRRPKDGTKTRLARQRGGPRVSTSGLHVTRTVYASGTVSFAGTDYQVGRGWRGKRVQVGIVNASVQVSFEGKVIKTLQIRHDRSKEIGADASPNGRPRKSKDPQSGVA